MDEEDASGPLAGDLASGLGGLGAGGTGAAATGRTGTTLRAARQRGTGKFDQFQQQAAGQRIGFHQPHGDFGR